jgi:hypothetical protein
MHTLFGSSLPAATFFFYQKILALKGQSAKKFNMMIFLLKSICRFVKLHFRLSNYFRRYFNTMVTSLPAEDVNKY